VQVTWSARRRLRRRCRLHHSGREPARQGRHPHRAFTQLLADLPDAAWDLKTQIYEGDVLFLEWAAHAAATFVEDGIDTFVFRDGLIRVQAVRYSLQHKG